MPLRSPLCYRQNSGECAECASRFIAVLSSCASKNPPLAALLEEATTLAVGIRTAIGLSRGSPLTKNVILADARRDEIHRELLKYLRGMRSHPIGRKADAGKLLYTIFEQYGVRLAYESYASESTKIKALLERLDLGDAKEAALELEASERIGELARAQDEFDEAYLNLVQAKAQNNRTPKINELVNPLRRCLTRILNFIDIMESVEPDDWGRTVSRINEVSVELAAKVRARLSRSSGAESDTEGESGGRVRSPGPDNNGLRD